MGCGNFCIACVVPKVMVLGAWRMDFGVAWTVRAVAWPARVMVCAWTTTYQPESTDDLFNPKTL
jgi:hypothetical protein